jgi:hypothetical protein
VLATTRGPAIAPEKGNGGGMLVQVHTDPTIEPTEQLTAQAEAAVAVAVGRFGERVTRVQVHVGDENSHKNGSADKRCMMEARLNGRPPVAVTHFAATVEQALDGAADKLQRTIDSTLGRLEGR